MQNTTAILESVDHDFLASVVGGCHKRHCGGCCQQQTQVQQTQIIQPVMQAPAAPAPDPGPAVSTNVSVGYH